MGSFCGSNPQTVVQTASNPNVTAQQNQVYGLANDYAQRFGGDPSQLIAPWNQLQTTAAQGVADNANAMQPWVNLGEGMTGQGSNTAGAATGFYGAGANTLGGLNPIASQGWNPTQYESPYTQDVINATRANIEQSNAVAQNGALGNLIQSGTAFGGDRAGVTMDELARNQALAENQTIAGLQQADFNQASQQANAQQQYLLNLGLGNNAQLLQQAGAYGQLGQGMTQAGLAQGNLGTQLGQLGSLGQSGLMNAYQGLYNMGVGLQGTQQQMLSAPMTFAQWYANASPGTASVPTSTTYPGANPLSTITGLGLAGLGGASILSNLGGLGLGLLHKGGRVNKDHGGAVDPHMHDLLSRYEHIKRAVGGDTPMDPGQMAMQTAYGPQASTAAKDTQIGKNAKLQNYLAAATEYGTKNQPATEQLGVNRMEMQQQAHGGRVHRDFGGGTGDGGGVSFGDGGGGTSIGDTWSAGATDASAPTFDPGQHLSDILDAHQRQQKTLDSAMKFLLNAQQASSPTTAPKAPGQADWSKIGKLGMNLGNMNNDNWIPETTSSKGGRIPHAADGLDFDDSLNGGSTGDANSYGGGSDTGDLSTWTDLFRRMAGVGGSSLPEIAPVKPTETPHEDYDPKTIPMAAYERNLRDAYRANPRLADMPAQPSSDLTAGSPRPPETTASRAPPTGDEMLPADHNYLPATSDYPPMPPPEENGWAAKTTPEPGAQTPTRPAGPKRLEDMTYDELARYQLMRQIRMQDRNQSMMPGQFLLQLARGFFPHRSGVGTMDPSFGAGAEGAANQITSSINSDSEAAARTANSIHAQQALAQQKELALKPQLSHITNDFGGQQPVVFHPDTGQLTPISVGAGANTQGSSLSASLPALPQNFDWTKKGEEFRAQLPPQWAYQMAQIAAGKEAWPSTSSRDPHAKMMAAMLPIAYPGIDATQWRARNDMRTDMGRGATGKQLASLDMYAQHAEELGKAIEDVHNIGFPGGNLVRNVTNPIAESLNPEGSGVRLKQLRVAGTGVGEEISKLLHGSPNVTGAEEWKHQMANETASRAEQRAINGKGADLVLGRVKALEDQWERTMGATREEMGEKPLISPQTRARLERLSAIGRQNISPEEYDAQHHGNAANGPNGAVHARPVPPKVAEILTEAVKTGAPTVKLPDGTVMPTKEFAQRVVKKLQSGQWIEPKHAGS